MGETTGAVEGRPPALGSVHAAGVVCSGIAAAGALVPLRRGEADPAVVLAVALAVIALAAFLGRRHGAFPRATTSLVAAGSSLGVLLTAGYALNRGISGAATLSLAGESWTVSFVGAAFFAAGAGLGLAAADYGGLGGRAVARRAQHAVALSIVGVSVFVVAALWLSFLYYPTVGLVGELSPIQETVIERLAMALGTVTVVIGFLLATDRGPSFIDLRRPTLRHVGWVIAGVVLVLGSNQLLSYLMAATNVETVTHSSIESGRETPEVLAALAVLSVLFTGPFEELLYRNVIQKALYESFSRPGAIVVASVVFASVHFWSYIAVDAHLGTTLASLTIVFALSLVLGAIYERTENLLVPAVAHGVYNAIAFLSQYAAAV